jgi:NTE family protein
VPREVNKDEREKKRRELRHERVDSNRGAVSQHKGASEISPWRPVYDCSDLDQRQLMILRSVPSLDALISTVFLGLALSGCAAFNYVEPDAPRALLLTELKAAVHEDARFSKPKIAVVLGSGGPRGYAHIGIIKVLEEAGIAPDLIVGTSVGALIGAFWAQGMKEPELKAEAFAGGPLTLFDLNPFADRGWIRGQKLQDYVSAQLNTKALENLSRPLIVVSTRRDDKTPVFFTRGSIAVAVRASSAVPGVISPVGIQGIEYEDGDVSMPVAVSIARAAGAEFVIAVDVSAHDGTAPSYISSQWIVRDEARRALIAPEVAKADFIFHPDMGYLAGPTRSFFEKAYRSGEDHARARLPELLSKLSLRPSNASGLNKALQ